MIAHVNSGRDFETEERVRGSLEISLPELEMMEGIVHSIFHINYAMKQEVPEELKALREKMSILRSDLVKEYERRMSLMDMTDESIQGK